MTDHVTILASVCRQLRGRETMFRADPAQREEARP